MQNAGGTKFNPHSLQVIKGVHCFKSMVYCLIFHLPLTKNLFISIKYSNYLSTLKNLDKAEENRSK